ncbi:MAG: T9SS type A sorting domain-containing protein [Cyclonatronaceae bacterium]
MSSATTSGLLIRSISAACFLAAFLPFHGFAQHAGSGYFHVAADGDGLYGVAPGADLYALRVLDADGRGRMLHILAAIEYSVYPDLPARMALSQNYPNPFNPSTTIRFDIPESSAGSNRVRLQIYDLTGRIVTTLIDQVMAAGSHNIVFDAGHLASGVFIYRFESGSGSLSRKMTLLK